MNKFINWEYLTKLDNFIISIGSDIIVKKTNRYHFNHPLELSIKEKYDDGYVLCESTFPLNLSVKNLKCRTILRELNAEITGLVIGYLNENDKNLGIEALELKEKVRRLLIKKNDNDNGKS